MSSIAPLGGQEPSPVSGLEPATMASPPPAPYLHGTLDGVAGLLQMSTADLRSSLKGGSSISDLAAQKGASRASILSYVERQVQQRRAANGREPIAQSVLDDVVGRALDRRRGSAAAPAASPQQPSSQSALDLYA